MRNFKDTRGKSWYDLVPEMDGQIDITVNYPGTIRAFHWHDKKIEWMFIVEGEVKFVLTDPMETIYATQGDCVKIEPHRWHGYQALGDKQVIVLEYADKKHDVENPDDERKPYNSFGEEWKKEKK
jgi:dTDP-4-dehydrorhamnose 3,5-epimerase